MADAQQVVNSFLTERRLVETPPLFERIEEDTYNDPLFMIGLGIDVPRLSQGKASLPV